jgi:hypothetical protein
LIDSRFVVGRGIGIAILELFCCRNEKNVNILSWKENAGFFTMRER